jgi:leucyl-tRNA synthetase
MKEYNHLKIEKKWQKDWDKKKIYQASNILKGKKFYSLIEFPYPSGAGLHVGHPRPYIGMDVVSRKRRMEGYNVLFPIGWDAFGLPTENYAIKTGIHPALVTKQNTNNFRRQIKMLGPSFDWSREVNTTDPAYYKWTQWIFLQMFKKGLAYKKKTVINWCPNDKIGLANEEVIDGKCERCGAETIKKEKEQWMLAITKYADRLDKDLDTVDYLEKIKIGQRNWIGKSEGSEIEFSFCPCAKDNIPNLGGIKIFTTRADTIFGATYVVLAPEHDLIFKIKPRITNWNEVKEYIDKVKKETDIERTAEDKTKTGVEIKGVKAINPATGEEIPIWIADYVLVQYGTGAVMAVPAHDERDFAFAKKYNLPIKQVIAPHVVDSVNPPREGKRHAPRVVVQGIIKHWEKDEVVQLAWKKFPWKTFVIGGAEEGESLEEAIKREVHEETGYKNFKSIRKLSYEMRSEWYALHKDENRYGKMHFFELVLANGEKDALSAEENEKHVVNWVPSSSLPITIGPCSELKDILNGLNGEKIYPLCYTGDGILINSGKFDEIKSEEARKEITKFVGGKIVTKYKLRDWIFSRQRYWGEPIPIIHCVKCGYVPVPDKDLPVILPKVKSYMPTDNGESPLSTMVKWVNVKCPKCKGKAKRETDTMPNWAGSSWYYLRYTDPKNKKEFASQKNLKYWTPVDWYNGGMEHTTLHLLYSRFWHKFLYDQKLVPTKEPYMKRTAHGMILAEGGAKMSKSKGNVVNPDDIVKIYGADTFRVYEMFIGPFDQTAVWNTESIIGSRRFLEKVWRIGMKITTQKQINSSRFTLKRAQTTTKNLSVSASFQTLLHKTIKKISEDIESMSFNTAVSSMMILANEMEKVDVNKDDFKMFLRILAPFAPHITEELWFALGEKKSIHKSEWPKWDKKKIIDEMTKIAVQVNGKVRTEIMISKDMTEDYIKNLALKNKEIIGWVEGKEIKRVIYVPGRVINIVV